MSLRKHSESNFCLGSILTGLTTLWCWLAMPFAAAAVPQSGEETGTLAVVVYDEIDAQTGEFRSGFLNRLLTSDGRVIELPETVAAEGLSSGTPVKVVWSAGGVEVLPLVSTATLSSYSLGAAVGEKTLVALIGFADAVSRSDLTLAKTRALVLTDADSVDAFVRENSYGRVGLQADYPADFIDWRVLPGNSTDYNHSKVINLMFDTVARLDAEVDFALYKHLIFFYAAPISVNGGYGSLGPLSLFTDEGAVQASVALVFTDSVYTAAHEFGHNVGFYHSATLNCVGAAGGLPRSLLDPGSSCTASGAFSEYGDNSDLMGSRYAHTNSYWKLRAGWIDNAQIQDASAGGDFILDQYELPSSGKKALKISIGTALDGASLHYWVERRLPLGTFDQVDEHQIRLVPQDLYIAEGAGSTTTGLWYSPNTVRFVGSGGAAIDIAAGTPFHDPYRGVKVELIGTTGTGSQARSTLRVSRSGIVLSPEGMWDFGAVLMGSTDHKSVTVTNGSAASRTLGTFAFGGRHAADFSLAAGLDTCSGQVLAAGAHCTVGIEFTPAADKFRFAELLVPSNDTLRPQAVLALHGKGLYAAAVSANPASVDFGTLVVGEAALNRQITLTNSGNRDLNIESISSTAYEFSTNTSDCLGRTLAPGATCSFKVTFNSEAAGSKTGQIGIIFNGNAYLGVPLTAAADFGSYNLAVERGDGGSVISLDGAFVDGLIDCGATCDTTLTEPKFMSLRARPDPGYEVAAWSGDCDTVLDDFCYLTLKQNRSVRAEFRVASRVWGCGLINVERPNGGEKIAVKSKQAVRWSSQCLDGAPVRVDLERGGEVVGEITPTIGSEEGSLLWRVPSNLPSGNNYRIRISTQDNGVLDRSDADFTVVGAITLQQPNGGERWQPGKKALIKWRYRGKTGEAVKILLLRGSERVRTIAKRAKLGTHGGGRFAWKVPKSLQPGNDYRVAVIRVRCRGCRDESDGFLSVGEELPLAPPPSSLSEDALSIYPVGLGASQLVTNSAVGLFHGISQASFGIQRIEFENGTTGASGRANGKEEWDAEIGLVPGDNRIVFRVLSMDGVSQVEYRTTVTYHQNRTLLSPLVLDHDLVYINEGKSIISTLMLPPGVSRSNPQVILFETDASGSLLAAAGAFGDDGVSPDRIARDGVFSAGLYLFATTPGQKCFRAKVAYGGEEFLSETRCVLVATRITDDEAVAAVQVGKWVRQRYDELRAGNLSMAEAAEHVASELESDSRVGASGVNGSGSVWWVTAAGLLGGHTPWLDGQKAGWDATGAAGATDADINHIHSNRAAFISPYIQHPTFPGGSFGMTDDSYLAGGTIKNTPACQLYMDRWRKNDQSIVVTLDHFKNFDAHGYIHFSSHGDSLYNGLWSNWKDVWGPKDFLQGSLAVVVIDTGIVVPLDADGKPDLQDISDDLKAHRIALDSYNTINLLPGFFRKYAGELPNSLVVVSTCRSMHNNSLAGTMLGLGAAGVVGFNDYVASIYAHKTTGEIVKQLYAGKTVGEGIEEAIKKFGASDNDSDPAELVYVGNRSLKLAADGIFNGGFEDGVLTPWQTVSTTGEQRPNDAWLVSEFEGTLPAEGSYMTYLGSGACESTEPDIGWIYQDICVPLKASYLRFSWKLQSSFMGEYCANPIDYPAVTESELWMYISRLRLDTGEVISDTTKVLFKRTAQQLCNASYITGTKNACWPDTPVRSTDFVVQPGIDISAYRGRALRLWFAAVDGGYRFHETQALVDNVVIENAP